MIPVDQKIPHDPENGLYGDCHRAALASVLEMPLEGVPHFMEGLGPKEGEKFEAHQREFLRSLGLVPIVIPFDGSAGLSPVLETLGAQNPGVFYLMGGETARGFGHTVVGCGGEIVHDPHPSKAGLIGPMDDGLFWVTFIGARLA